MYCKAVSVLLNFSWRFERCQAESYLFSELDLLLASIKLCGFDLAKSTLNYTHAMTLGVRTARYVVSFPEVNEAERHFHACAAGIRGKIC